MRQLPLDIRLSENARFENYMVGSNAVAVGLCQQLAQQQGDKQVYLWGAPSSGKSHLLQASCALATQQAHASIYIPMSELMNYGPEALLGLEDMALVCIDDVDLCAGHPAWEQSVFNLINACRATGARLLLSASNVAQSVGVQLQDLESRLAWGAVVHINELDDEHLVEWLQQVATARGLAMPAEVAQYILKHCERDMGFLIQLVHRLDQASLAEQRKLTIPLVKVVLSD